MSDPKGPEEILSTEQLVRVKAAQIAAHIVRVRTFGSVGPVGPGTIVMLAEWIINGDHFNNINTGDDELSLNAPEVSDTLILKLIYGSPITRDTVNALCDAHRDDEDLVEVTGHLL